MVLRGIDADKARVRLETALSSGVALEAWSQMVVAHGGDPDPDRLPSAIKTHEIGARSAGIITGIASADLGRIAATVGAGRSRRDDALAFGAGVTVHARIGDRIESGQPLATLEVGERPVDIDAISRRIATAFEIGDEQTMAPELVLGTVDQVDPTSFDAD
jgi:thymidine phosphorylase